VTHKEIAEILGIPRGTVKSRLHNAIKILKEELEGDFGGSDPFEKEQYLRSKLNEYNVEAPDFPMKPKGKKWGLSMF